ncbi:MAG: flagellar assembly protein FliW [Pirellulaceae bacterium]|jgi:flagellar assembly factor FliW|nr:flagellar assembly protein FliW [Pirellulaceae bacterium]MDP7014975.1 flagellar assembly protein FliW [Pirellulaceae bacterium]
MQIATSRFGNVEIAADDILIFPHGMIGFTNAKHWVLLADSVNPAVGWLQSVAQHELAFAVVSPRRFVSNYQVRVSRREVAPLGLAELSEAYVLAIVSRRDDQITVNLKAPLIINLDGNVGRQVVVNDDQPLQLVLGGATQYRRSA